jgi:tetratricopeptide (TPR) repeat protein
MKSIIIFVLSTVFLTSGIANSAESKKLPIDPKRKTKIEFYKPEWNKSPLEIDEAAILLRDRVSKKVIQIKLQETEPDSNVFSGTFAVRFSDNKEIMPELYLPPQRLMKTASGIQMAYKMMKQRKLRKMPHVFRTDFDTNTQIIEIHENKKAALKAYNEYQELLGKREEEKKPKIKPIPDESTLQAQRLAAIAAEKARLEEEARKREAERLRLKRLAEEEARRKKEEAKRMKAEEKAKRKAEASKLAQQAIGYYRQGNFVEAEKLFKQSIDLDPENDGYYYQYAVSLYRNQKYNDALVYFRLAEGEGVNISERDYFMGLCHVRLKEFPDAIKIFDKVIARKEPNISASAAFYKGIVYFTLEEYDNAKPAFQYVLDNSQDPRMDEQAETYIEKIAAIKQFEANKAKRFLFSILLASQYDSNVLSTDPSGSSSGDALGYASMRTLGSFGVEYRPLFDEKHEASLKTTYLSMVSANSEVQSADPQMLSVALPYKRRTKLWDKVWQWSAQLGMDDINLNGVDTMTSTHLTLDSTHIMSADHIKAFKLVLGADQLADVTSTDDDSSGSKVTFTYTHTNFLDKKKTKGLIYDGGFQVLSANGKNAQNQKLTMGAAYMMPWVWESGLNLKLSAYYLTYPNKDTPRTDTNLAFTATATKPILDWMMGLSTFNYTTNSSSDSSNTYGKYSLMIGVMMTPSW